MFERAKRRRRLVESVLHTLWSRRVRLIKLTMLLVLMAVAGKNAVTPVRQRHSCRYCFLQQRSTVRLLTQFTILAIADAHPCAPSINFLVVFKHRTSITQRCAASYTLVFCWIFATQTVFVSVRLHVHIERAPTCDVRVFCLSSFIFRARLTTRKTGQTSFSVKCIRFGT